MMERFLRVALASLGPGRINKEVAPQSELEVQCGLAQKCFVPIYRSPKKGETHGRGLKSPTPMVSV